MIVCSTEYYLSSRLLPNTYKQTWHASRVSFISRVGRNLHFSIFIWWKNPKQSYSVIKWIDNMHFSKESYPWYSICFPLGHKAGSMNSNCRSLARPLVGIGHNFFQHWVSVSPSLFRWHTGLCWGYKQFLSYSLYCTWRLGCTLLEKISWHQSVKRRFCE